MNDINHMLSVTDFLRSGEPDFVYYFGMRPEIITVFNLPKITLDVSLKEFLFEELLKGIDFSKYITTYHEYHHINYRSLYGDESDIWDPDTVEYYRSTGRPLKKPKGFGSYFNTDLIFVDRTNQLMFKFGLENIDVDSLYVFSMDKSDNRHIREQIKNCVEHYCKEFLKKHKNDYKVNILIQKGNQVLVSEYSIDPDKVPNTKETHYNDDFLPFSEHIESCLKEKKSSGLVVLHGQPGSGKTTYLRYLMGAIKDKRLIYVPPAMSEALAHPDLLQILLAHRNSILLIEDAEMVVMNREDHGHNNQAVSNLLNMSDGILSDLLQIQIVCTFNTDISNIDKALLRPGRLLGEYKFGPLSKEKSQKLVDELYGNGTYKKHFGLEKELTLAEIYSLDEPRFVSKQKKRAIGFVPID